jgi:hypothetical protein
MREFCRLVAFGGGLVSAFLTFLVVRTLVTGEGAHTFPNLPIIAAVGWLISVVAYGVARAIPKKPTDVDDLIDLLKDTKSEARHLGPLRTVVAVLFFALGMTAFWATWWMLAYGWSAWASRNELASGTEVLALVEATGERELTRRHVRQTEPIAAVVWRDAQGSVRRATIRVQPGAFVQQGAHWFVRIRFFENDPSRLPTTNDAQDLLKSASQSEATAISSLIVVFVSITGMAGLYAVMWKLR